ncbi:hypothetical protein MAHJHV54_43900 [Mycobacterium avium subsp. hominissuis]
MGLEVKRFSKFRDAAGEGPVGDFFSGGDVSSTSALAAVRAAEEARDTKPFNRGMAMGTER